MNKFLPLLFLFLSLLETATSQSQVKQATLAQSELNRRGEVYFSFQLNEPARLTAISKKLSVSKVEGNTVFAFANQKEFSEFSNYNFDYQILTSPSEQSVVSMTDSPQQVLTWNYYPTYTAYESLMQQFAAGHPDICKMITIATLASGRKILGLRISDNVDIEENEPEFLYSATIHGNETAGYILMLHLADYILTGYGSDARVNNLVNNFEIVICPLANPDGTYKSGNSTVYGATRSNANSIDLNRNYPDPEDGQHPDVNTWQPETKAFMEFAKQNSFTMAANFHGGTEVVNYPWDTWPRLSADDAWWVYVSREYADTVHLNAPADYMNYYENGITNGYQWYEVAGGRQDYMNYFHHCREATIEVSDAYILPTNQLLAHWNYNYRSLLNYIEQAGYGLHGLVTDSASGEPLNASVYISGFDKDSSNVYTDPQVGDYHRLLKSGNYNVTYSASGYIPKTFAVQVTDRKKTVLDVKLSKVTLSTGFSKTIQTDIKIFPNPVIAGITIIESSAQVQELMVRDVSGKILFYSKPKQNSFTVDCTWPSGLYLFQIKAEGGWINKKIQVINH